MPSSVTISGAVQFQAPSGSQIVSETLNLSTSLTPNGSTMAKSIAAITNSATQQTLVNVSTPGTIILRNLDGGNSIMYGPNATSMAAILAPGALNIYSPNGANLYAQTTSGLAQLQIFAMTS